MDDRSTHIDASAWRVAPLSDDFADDVLARLDEPVMPSSTDALDLLEVVVDDGHVIVPRSTSAGPRPVPPVGIGVIALVVAVAALLLLWLARPRPAIEPHAPVPSAPVTDTAPVTPHELDRDGVRRAIAEQFLPVAKRCYDALLTRDAAAQGRVTLVYDVARREDRGIVVHAEIGPDPEIRDRTFHECLLDGIRKVVFDPPREGDTVHVVSPFVFRPGTGGGEIDVAG